MYVGNLNDSLVDVCLAWTKFRLILHSEAEYLLAYLQLVSRRVASPDPQATCFLTHIVKFSRRLSLRARFAHEPLQPTRLATSAPKGVIHLQLRYQPVAVDIRRNDRCPFHGADSCQKSAIPIVPLSRKVRTRMIKHPKDHTSLFLVTLSFSNLASGAA